MKKSTIILVLTIAFFYSCSTTQPILKTVAYKGMYSEKPLTVLLMPPINKTTSVDAKEYFHSTLNVPIANAGFYVIPTFLSMEILKRESAYDAELFLNSPLTKFGEVFGADVALFTIIHKWDKTYGMVYEEVEYVIKSVKTNEVLYTRKGQINYNTNVQVNNAGLEGAVIINKVKESEPGMGFDAAKENYVNMVEAGILDPVKVTRSALQNATSVASTLLTTESVVANIKEDVPPMPAGGGMGMM